MRDRCTPVAVESQGSWAELLRSLPQEIPEIGKALVRFSNIFVFCVSIVSTWLVTAFCTVSCILYYILLFIVSTDLITFISYFTFQVLLLLFYLLKLMLWCDLDSVIELIISMKGHYVMVIFICVIALLHYTFRNVAGAHAHQGVQEPQASLVWRCVGRRSHHICQGTGDWVHLCLWPQ